jgi:hypothetical protein
MNKLRENTLVAVILIISKGFYNFKTLKNWLLESIVFQNNAMMCVMSRFFVSFSVFFCLFLLFLFLFLIFSSVKQENF